ncbi:MAG: MarR family transcriptional regulator [Planctomycetota bacterium]
MPRAKPRESLALGRPAAEDSPLDRDAWDLHEALAELVRVYQFRDRERICCHDISVTQCYALSALIRRGPLKLGELAAELYLDKSTASRVVDSLERKGYVRRASDRADGRALRLQVTVKGKGVHARIEADLVAGVRALVADLDPDVRQAAARLIARLARAATERCARGGGSDKQG